MNRPAASIMITVVALFFGKGLVAKGSGGKGEQSQLKDLRAPTRPDMQWLAPDLRSFSEPLREDHPSELDPDKEYELAELIDVAERTNPETKVAWAHAKEAASAVGLAKSEYYPILALKASGVWANLPVPLPVSTS